MFTVPGIMEFSPPAGDFGTDLAIASRGGGAFRSVDLIGNLAVMIAAKKRRGYNTFQTGTYPTSVTFVFKNFKVFFK